MLGVLLFAAVLQGTFASDTISFSEVRAEYTSTFDILAVPPGGPQALVVAVRRNPEGGYLAAYQREHPWVLTYLIQHGISFDLGEIEGRPEDWDKKIAAAQDALARDRRLERLIGTVLAGFLHEQGLVLEGYPVLAQRERIPLGEIEELAARFFYPDAVRPDGTIQAHICTNINAASELPLSQNLLVGAFTYAAVRNHMDEIMPEFEKAMGVAQRLATSPDPATVVARAQGVVWSHLVKTGVLRRALMAESEAQAAFFPFFLDLGESSGAQAAGREREGIRFVAALGGSSDP